MHRDTSLKPSLPSKELFKHLEYEYRCLAMAAHAWTKFGKHVSDDNDIKKIGNFLVPEISTMAQDSLLLHVRNLIEFYSSGGRPTDLRIDQFPNNIFNPAKQDLNKFQIEITSDTILLNLKVQIEVHALHATLWRDLNFRTTQNNDTTIEKDRPPRQRPDFDCINRCLFEKMISLLEMFRDMHTDPNKQALKELIIASKGRFAKGSNYPWPTIEYK